MSSVARKVILGVSGGVDSAAAALLLKKKGFIVEGLFMKNWDMANEVGQCQSDLDLEDAQFVCKHLDIPLHEVNFVKEYWNGVFSDLLRGYEKGITPNPDILCNKIIKFDAFFKHAVEKLGADAIATGHYARASHALDLDSVDPREGSKLLIPADTWKDQTFFLSQISQTALQKTLFPLGDLTKGFVKKLVSHAGMDRIAKRKESMGICFIGSRNFPKFIEQYIEPKEGRFIHIDTGEELGKHKGIHYWTIGQRALIGGRDTAYFVVEQNPDTQDIIVAPGTNHPALFSQSVFTEPAHWIHSPPRELLTQQMCDVQCRYQHSFSPMKCTITLSGSNCLIVSLDKPMRSLTPGQFAVFYQGQECLGSAKIIKSGPSLYTLNYGNRTSIPEENT